MRTKVRRLVPFLFPLALIACATTNPPGELLSARASYERAASGKAATVAPAELHDAKVALDRAEQSFGDDGKSQQTKDLAYIAERKADRAEAIGRTVAVQKERLAAEDERAKLLAKIANKGEAQARAAGEEAKVAKTELASERAAREAAEARASDALDALAKSAAVKKEARGIVITLSGSVLFAFGKSELLPAARSRLDEVAEALKTSTDRTFVVEGHTDSVGKDDDNLSLSQKRAEAVRIYLVSRGVDPAKIGANGKGETAPVDTNATAEGRAVNRRVEIVMQTAAEQSGTMQGGGPPTEN